MSDPGQEQAATALLLLPGLRQQIIDWFNPRRGLPGASASAADPGALNLLAAKDGPGGGSAAPGAGPGAGPTAPPSAADRIWCPPVLTIVTGVGPRQAHTSDKTAYSRTPGNAIPNGYVAVNPEMFGVPRDATDPQRKALSQIQLYPDWSAAKPPNGYTPAIPRGLPSTGPYRVSDALNPPTKDYHVDLYRYGNMDDAKASTRPNIPMGASIPNNGLVKCPPPLPPAPLLVSPRSR
jgi:hypothetical protein